MITQQTKTKNNFNRRKKVVKNGCGKCECQLKKKSKSKFELLKEFVLKLLHLG